MNYVVLVFIVFMINQCGAGNSTKGNPRIFFDRSSAGTVEQAMHYTVVMNKSLHIYFRDMDISRGWCFNYYNHSKQLDEWEPTKFTSANFYFENVTANMSILWNCNMTEKIQVMVNNCTTVEQKNHVFYLNLHVKGAKSVKFYINYQEVTFSKPDLSEFYDGYALYYYEDGQNVKFECWNMQKTGTVHLEYIKKGATTLFDSKINYSLIRMQLYSRNQPMYFDCVYTNVAPLEKYVYRVILILKKPLVYFNESKKQSVENNSANQHTVKISTSTDTAKKSASQDTDKNFSPIILGSSIGAVLVVLGVIGLAYWFVRRRNSKHIETPYADVSSQPENQTPQHSNEIENQYDLCHYDDRLSKSETYAYSTPEGIEHIDPKDHFYTEIVYFACKVNKVDESQTRNSQVYDEPYVQITVNNKMQK